MVDYILFLRKGFVTMRREKILRSMKFEAAVLAACLIIGLTSVFSDMMPIAMATIFKIVSAGAGDVVELAVAVGHEFVALLGGGVEAHGVVYAFIGAEGHFLVASVYAAGTCIHQMLYWIMTTSF